jgi:hypothetical protein
LPLNVWLAKADIKGPIPDRDAHVVESKIRTTRLDFGFERCRTSPRISTYPAAATAAKSLSVIHVLQC